MNINTQLIFIIPGERLHLMKLNYDCKSFDSWIQLKSHKARLWNVYDKCWFQSEIFKLKS